MGCQRMKKRLRQKCAIKCQREWGNRMTESMEGRIEKKRDGCMDGE